MRKIKRIDRLLKKKLEITNQLHQIEEDIYGERLHLFVGETGINVGSIINIRMAYKSDFTAYKISRIRFLSQNGEPMFRGYKRLKSGKFSVNEQRISHHGISLIKGIE